MAKLSGERLRLLDSLLRLYGKSIESHGWLTKRLRPNRPQPVYSYPYVSRFSGALSLLVGTDRDLARLDGLRLRQADRQHAIPIRSVDRIVLHRHSQPEHALELPIVSLRMDAPASLRRGPRPRAAGRQL